MSLNILASLKPPLLNNIRLTGLILLTMGTLLKSRPRQRCFSGVLWLYVMAVLSVTWGLMSGTLSRPSLVVSQGVAISTCVGPRIRSFIVALNVIGPPSRPPLTYLAEQLNDPMEQPAQFIADCHVAQ